MQIFIFHHTPNVILEVEGSQDTGRRYWEIETLQQRQVRQGTCVVSLSLTHLISPHYSTISTLQSEVKPLFMLFWLYIMLHIIFNKDNNIILLKTWQHLAGKKNRTKLKSGISINEIKTYIQRTVSTECTIPLSE